MAGGPGGEKYIGKLSLDIKDVQKQIEEVNAWLGKIGANINLEDKLSQKVSAALHKLVNEAKQAGEEASKALAEGASKSKFDTIYEKMEQKMLAFENKMQAEAEKAIAKADQRAEREAAATERAEERKRQAREKQEQRYQQVWDKAARDREAQDAKEAANIDKQIAKYEAQDAKRAASAEKAAEREEQARAKKEAAYNDMWHRAEQQREQELAAEEAKLEQEVAKAEEASQRKAQIEEEAAAKAAAARAKQEADYQLVWDKASYEQRQAAIRQYQQDIENYSKALAAYFTEIDNLQKQIVSGKVTEGSERYKAFTDNIARLKEEAQQAGASLDQAGKQTAASMQNVQTAVANLSKSSASIRDSKTPDYLKQVTAAYNTLREAINNYNIAKKANNTSDMQTWQAEIDKQMGVISGVEQIVGSLNIEKNVREQIVLKIQEAKTLQDGFTKGVVGGTTAASELESQMTGLLTRMFSIMAVIRSISSLIQNTVEYVSEYSDKMNEIQMITLKTDAEIEKLGKTYRQIAEDMNVSSLDMADAAIYFTRQGLAAGEIEKRLKNVTMYAKAANVEFTEASEIITAVVNSMGLVDQELEDGRNAAQRVADVFLKVGDSAATSGQEIGEAMQKAAASAGAFGMSFEWLASYIATVSETTRQEARTIGTALNTIIARLHQIKQTGYNSEDETKINDVQKALAKIGVTLMDNNNEWRDMDTIFQEIGSQWGDLDGKTKSYIATTMAGVKQQNVFLALMNDLGKGVENGSRAWELYTKSINSAGTAEEKYAVYKDSVAAAQDRLNIAEEKFYSLIDASAIKGWYDMLAGLINIITSGTKAFNGLNIVLPITIALIANLGKIISSTIAVFNAHPVMLTITGIAVAITALTGLGSLIDAFANESKEAFGKASEALEEYSTKVNTLEQLQKQTADVFKDLDDKTEFTAENLSKYNALLDELCDISPVAKRIVGELREGMIDQTEAARQLNEELQKQIDLNNRLKLIEGIKKYSNYQSSDNIENIYQMMTANFIDQDSPNAFKDWLRVASMNAAKGDFNYITKELYEKVKNQIDSLKHTSMSTEEKWGFVAQGIWYELFGTYDMSKNPMDKLEEQVNTEIDNAIAIIEKNMTSVEKLSARKMLTDIVFGGDDELDISEYATFAQRISKFLTDFYRDGIDMIHVDAGDALEIIGKDMFGELFDMYFDRDTIEEIAKDPAKVNAIGDAYSELLAAGFSSSDLATFYKNLDLSKWDQAVEYMKEEIREKISNFAGDELGRMVEDVDTGETIFDPLLWASLDISTLQTIENMVEFGVSLDDIKQAMIDSDSVDDFKERLDNLGKSAGYVGEETEETTKSIDDFIKEIKADVKEIDKLAEVIELIRGGDTVDLADILDLASAHPEILSSINDLKELQAVLEKIQGEKSIGIIQNIKDMILDNADIAVNSPFADKMTDGETLREYMDRIGDDADAYQEVADYLEQATVNVLAATGNLDKASKENLIAWEHLLSGRTNMDWGNRPNIDAKNLTAAGWEGAGEGFATIFSNTMSAGGEGADFKWNQNVIVDFTPILPNGEVMTPEACEEYLQSLFDKSANLDELFENDADTENGGKGILISVASVLDDQSFEEAMENESSRMEILHRLEEAIYGVNEAEKDWLETMVEEAAVNAELEYAKSNGYADQISQLNDALNSGNGGLENAVALWNTYTEDMQKAIAKTYPQLARAILDAKKNLDSESKSTKDAEKATDDLNKALQKSAKYANAKHFTSTYDAIKKLEAGTISATDAYDAFNKELDNVKKAAEDISDVESKLANKTDVTVSDVSNLAKVLGMSAEQILADWPSAVAMFDELTGASGELTNALNMLNDAAFIKITGTADADFSALELGLVSVQNLADETIQKLIATGQWEVVTEALNADAWVNEGTALAPKWVKKHLKGYQQILKPTGNNPFKGRSTTKSDKGGRGGGGGGGGSKKDDTETDTSGPTSSASENTMTEVERMLDMMSQVKAIDDYQRSYYQSQQKYFSQNGLLQGVISAMKLERNELEENNKTIEKNISEIEKQMKAKQAELAGMSTSDEAYEEVADDLDKLQKAHQSYTNELIDNKTAIDQLTKSMDEQKKKILQMEIDLRNLIYSAIEDREAKLKNMLSNEIEMENTIFEIIKARYEKERDSIIEANNLRIESLQREKDLLSEQLRIRKEQAEIEDKQAQLAKLELQYTRISADPTRQKEALNIQKQIKELREEMAWDTAEAEVKAQQDSIDQQIDSLEDYIAYIENYYEELFENPKQLIEEMRQIIEQTDEEIIAWLKENDENYRKSSENTQRQMVESWNDTLREMRGQMKLYWDEVEDIIKKGDKYIINFLKENKADYAKAGKLQAEAYVDEWKKQLDDLRKAHEEAAANIASSYATIAASTYTGDSDGPGSSSSSSKGGGGGGKGSGDSGTPGGTQYGYVFTDSNTNTTYRSGKIYGSKNEAITYGETMRNYVVSSYRDRGEYKLVGNITGVQTYKRGGYADFTGPAWLDGTKQNPEAVLNPYQTKLFESMIESLERMTRIQIPTMPNFDGFDFGGENVSIGDIIVNVDNLDTDDDYETLAQKVSDIMMERIGRTTVVGGLRINSI